MNCRFPIVASTWPLVLLAVIAHPTSAAELTVERTDRGAAVEIDGKPFAEYLTRSGHQPAVWPINGPTGAAMTRSFPVGPLLAGEMDDHPHHHSLWFTHGAVNGIDFWTGKERHGKDNVIEHREFLATESDGETATIVVRNDWLSEGRKICQDERTLVFGADQDARWIDFTVTLQATEGDLTLGETKEGTFAVRTSGPLTVDTNDEAHLVNDRGQTGKEVWGRFAKWIDNYGPVDGQTIGIAMMSHPDNFRHPTRWHARTYGLLTANPFGEEEFPTDEQHPEQGPLTIAQGDELELRYRVYFHTGTTDEADVAEAYEQFARPTSHEK